MSITDIPGLILPRQAYLEEDPGAEYLPMPSSMSTYHAPVTPEVEDIDQYPRSLETMHALAAGFAQVSETNNFKMSLDHLNEKEQRLVDQFLGEGEVSIVVESDQKYQIQESVLTGVWRVHQTTDSQAQLSLEIGAIPECVIRSNATDPEIEIEADTSDELMNAKPIMAEIIERNRTFVQSNKTHVINLSLLPVNEADTRWLVEKLGYGGVTILSRGYGNCRITRTQLQHVWWVQYFNSMDTLILNTLEVTHIPEVACAAVEDIRASQERLQVMLEAYR
jgi:hydrogenase-1 operon protein HyaF